MTDVGVDEVAQWLRDVGYPFNWNAPDHPLPDSLRWPLTHAWREGDEQASADDWYSVLAFEGGWS